jgi:hypothetical protein
MIKFGFVFRMASVVILTLVVTGLAHAQATRTWVSGVGDDVNPCSRTAPCKTWAGAISKTARDGEINALDPGGFGVVSIVKSITLDGTSFMASTLNSGTNGININITDVNDVRKAVILRGLSINGGGTGTRGVNVLAATSVFIINCHIFGQHGAPGHGVHDSRAGGGLLEITNTTIVSNAGDGIRVEPSTGSTQLNVHISNCTVQKNANGFFAGSNVRASIYQSVFSQNTSAGIAASQTAGGNTDVNVNLSMVSNNVTGFSATTANAIIRVSNTMSLNNNGLANAGLAIASNGGIVSSYGNNQTGGVAFPSANTGNN